MKWECEASVKNILKGETTCTHIKPIPVSTLSTTNPTLTGLGSNLGLQSE